MSTLIANTLQGINTIKYDANTTAMTIDSNGTVLMPQKPAWRLGLTTAQNETTTGGNGQTVLWTNTSSDNCFIQGDLSYDSSTGILTCNTAGIYQINANIRVDDVGSGYVVTRILKNNASTNNTETYSIEGSPSSSYQTVNAMETYKLDAGDNLRIRVVSSADSSWSIATQSTFSGHMVG